MTLSFVDKLDADERVIFEQWYKSGDIKDLAAWRDRVLHSVAIETASDRMFATLDRAEQKAESLSVELSDVTTPVQKLINEACTAACTHSACGPDPVVVRLFLPVGTTESGVNVRRGPRRATAA